MCVVVAGEEEGFDKFPNCLNNKLPCWVRLNYNRGKFEGGKLLNWANLILRESSLSSALPESREITKINAIVPSGREEKERRKVEETISGVRTRRRRRYKKSCPASEKVDFNSPPPIFSFVFL